MAASRGRLLQRRPVCRAGPARTPTDELDLLRAASKDDWSKVRPEIFGTLFQHSLGKDERHAFGAHFTTRPTS